ncbi:hypothetical protein [Haladaptatus sp. DYSN1]|uniref:DUF7523 family protein n=1 Tax=unclassified Haladaptatus TaxID=2622732 RepID=UPI0024062248|nr:hypothetical protein [Haladaptatus sp. DYSN1]
MSSLAAETRTAVRDHPFLRAALAAGVVNYTAAARFLDIGDTEAVTAALRRFAADLPDFDTADGRPRVSMQSGLGEGPAAEALVTIGDKHFAPGNGRLTAISAAGDFDVTALAHTLSRLAAADIEPLACAGTAEFHVFVVERRDAPTALRVVEASFSSIPNM